MDIVEAAARNLAAWHAALLDSLGAANRRLSSAWVATGPHPEIYFDAVTTGRDLPEPERALLDAALADGTVKEVCDSHRRLDLGSAGMIVGWTGTWMARPAGPLPDTPVMEQGLVVRRVDTEEELALWEATDVAGFEAPARPRLSLQSARILRDPRMAFWLASLDGQPVGAANSFVAEGVVGVYSVAVLPGWRRRGYGTALTSQALRAADLPAVLSPSALGAGVYSALGFRETGTFSVWRRPRAALAGY